MTARLLVYTRTTDYRHDSIPDAVAALRTFDGVEVDHTEDPSALEAGLDACAAVVFLSTSGDVLTPAGRDRLAAYVEDGGAFVGVHAAACTEEDWPYYGELLGARFARHPEYQPGRAVVEDRDHPATRNLPPSGSSPTSGTTSAPTPGPECGCCCAPTRRRTTAAAWARTTPWPGPASRARAASSTPPSATPRRPTGTPPSSPTCGAASTGRWAGQPRWALGSQGSRVSGCVWRQRANFSMAAGVTGVKKLTRLPSGSRKSSDRLPQGIVVGPVTKSVTKPVRFW